MDPDEAWPTSGARGRLRYAGMIRLGPFDLTETVGRGGMGEVWRASHRESGAIAAVKVLREVEETWHVQRFAAEIRLMARLDHPGIAYLLDSGEVPMDAARASGGKLRPGAGWLAIEFASGGSLATRCGRTRWPQARPILLEMLEALAHAHARDVVHRDLKPGNVLLATPGDGRAGWKITDFGLARASGDTTTVNRIAGTPMYMAPEQIDREIGPFGPWTDLYALGAVAWALVTGRPPFGDRKGMDAVMATLGAPLPALLPRAPVPPGLDAWLRRMLAREPEQRFSCAADAAAALRGLETPASDEEETTHRVAQRPLAPRGTDPARHVPSSWRARQSLAPPPPRGTGLGLLGLRYWPLVAREFERDALWAALVDACSAKTTRVVLLRGPSGVGRTRLAAWLVERSQEVGAAWTAHVACGELPGAAVALASRILRLDRPGETAWLSKAVDRLAPGRSAEVLTALARGFSPGDSGGRIAALRAGLVAMNRHRPLVLVLDDVERDPEMVALVRALVLDPPGPTLVVITASEEGLAESPAVTQSIEQVGVRTLALGPLDSPAVAALAAASGLAPPLAGRLEQTVHGNPRLLEELLAEWMARGWLIAGPAGVDLSPTARPWESGAGAAWDVRLDRVLADLPSEAFGVLERGVALGPVLTEREWALATRDLPGATRLRTALVDRMIASRLLEDRGQKLCFSQEAFRLAVITRARAAGRWAAAAAAAAAVPGLSEERLGTLLLEAERPGEAIGPLLAALLPRARSGGYRAGLALAETAERALAAARSPAEDPRWGEVWLQRARLYSAVDLAEAEVQAQHALTAARRYEWGAVAAGAAVTLGLLKGRSGELDAAERLFRTAVEAASAAGAWATAGLAWHGLSRAAASRGDKDAAERHARKAAECHGRSDEPRDQVSAWRMLAFAGLLSGNLAEVREACSAGRAAAREQGDLVGEHLIVDILAEGEHQAGHLETVEALLHEQIALHERIGILDNPMPHIHLALVYLESGRIPLAQHALASVTAGHDAPIRHLFHSVAAGVAAEAGQWDEVAHHLDGLDALRGRTLAVRPEPAACLRRVEDLSLRAGRDDLSERAYELAEAEGRR